MFVIGDTHFYHKNIIEYCNRPFKNEIEMNEYIIDKWNSKVSNNDIIFHLGDFGIGWDKNFKSKRECYKNLMSKLKGKKYLIRGNHDSETRSFYLDIGFEEVYNYYIFDKYLLVHYPLEINEFLNEKEKNFIYSLKQFEKLGFTIIHGHTHNRNTKLKNHINVSVENINYEPLFIKENLF